MKLFTFATSLVLVLSLGTASIAAPAKPDKQSTTFAEKVRKALNSPRAIKVKKASTNAFKKAKAVIHNATKP
jgi:hypothetical protein